MTVALAARMLRTTDKRLLWKIAYAELYFTDKLWPDFAAADFDAAVAHFAGRQRRYGHTGDQIGAA